MNILTNAQIKRRGIAAVEDALRRGPVHLIKRNRQVGVVVSEADYAAAAAHSGAQPVAAAQPDFLDWFMADQPSGNLDAAGLQRRIAKREGSDLDLLVDAPQGTTLFDIAGFEEELREALGVPVQVLTEGDLPQRIRGRVLAEAQPL